MSPVAVPGKVMDELNQLRLAGQHSPEPMLQGIEYVVCLSVLHDMSGHNMLEEFAADAGQTYGPVVCSKSLLPLLVYGSNISIAPVLGYHTSLIRSVKEVC